MSKTHPDLSACSLCAINYKQRLLEMEKYIGEMFFNLSKNQILKQMYGTPDLQKLRLKKVQQIIKEALHGEKEQHIQSLVEKNVNLMKDLQLRNTSKQKNQKTQKVKQQYNGMIQESNLQHQREIDILEQQYKRMLVSSIEEYQLEFKKLSEIYQQQLQAQTERILYLESLHRSKFVTNQEQMRALNNQLNNKNILLKELDDKLAASKLSSMMTYTAEYKLLNQSMQVLARQNVQLKESLYLIGLQNEELKKRQSMIIIEANSAIREGEEFILKTQVPQIILNSQVQLYKLKEEYQTQIFMCHKKYSIQIESLKDQINRLKIGRAYRSRSIDRVGKITNNKKQYSSLMQTFGKELGNLKRQFTESRELVRMNKE